LDSEILWLGDEQVDKPIQLEFNEPDKGDSEDLATFSSTATPSKDNRTSIVAIIAVAVVTLVCICACTAIIITALMMIPTY
jgi:hypothetical protein